ncbi:MAG: enoyl-CoA hydratase/isomerase family protein [Pseudomonadota bacterium]
MTNLVQRTDDDGLCWLKLNRPDKLNALTVDMFRELRQHVLDIHKDDKAKVIVLHGAGKCFSAGHDLADISEGEIVPSPGWHSETLRLLEKLPKPVIAAVHSHCYTGALEVALAADLIIAASNSRFADTHAKWALTPIWGMSQRLPRRVGIATAKRLMFTAETVGAEDAVRMGLAELVFETDAFLKDVETFARQILQNSSFSHAANKRLLDATDSTPLDGGLQWEVMENEGVGPDMQDRIAAFTQR